MRRNKYTWDNKKIEKYKKEGRGNGEGSEYKPWITVQDVPSLGRARRIRGNKIPRIHHLLSDLEYFFFLILDWSDAVVDIKEQYPILDVESTLEIAKLKNIKHPVDKDSLEPIVLTSDFCVSMLLHGEETMVIRTVKPSEELEKKRTLEKLEIEREYWESKKIDWGIVTEKELPSELVKNLEWLYNSFTLEELKGLSIEELKLLIDVLRGELQSNQDLTIMQLLKLLDEDYKLQPGVFLSLFKHMLANKKVMLNMNISIDLNKIMVSTLKIN